MKHKISELEGALLDAAVAKATGDDWSQFGEYRADMDHAPYSTCWEFGGPIIERERMIVTPIGPVGWGVFYANEFDVSPDLVQDRQQVHALRG